MVSSQTRKNRKAHTPQVSTPTTGHIFQKGLSPNCQEITSSGGSELSLSQKVKLIQAAEVGTI